jgi:uncharacterized membrane protein YeaQ/YmgE (transglycosylase-associated protein family)
MKSLIYIGIFVGGTIGSYIPTLFGQDMFSIASIVGSLVGSIAGLWIRYKLSTNL